MSKVSPTIFRFNFFKDKEEIKKLLINRPLDYFMTTGTILFGLFIFYGSFSYINKDLIAFTLGVITSIIFGIYCPIMYYVNGAFYSRVIIFLKENKKGELSLYLYNKQRIRIQHYEIIDDWKPYFATFFLFIYKLESYHDHWLFQVENTKYYTIKDLDTGILYFYCIHKEQYLQYLENQHTE